MGRGPPRPSNPGACREESPATGRRDRAQTTTDFAVGASIFLLTAAFVFAFIPGIFSPFVDGPGQDRAVVADRVASELSASLLVVHPNEPYVLDEGCTAAFFQQVTTTSEAPTTCRYDATDGANSVGDAVDVDSLENVNVTLSDATSEAIVCRDGATAIVPCTDASADAPATAGDPSPGTGSVVAASRLVTIDGDQYRLVVRVW